MFEQETFRQLKRRRITYWTFFGITICLSLYFVQPTKPSFKCTNLLKKNSDMSGNSILNSQTKTPMNSLRHELNYSYGINPIEEKKDIPPKVVCNCAKKTSPLGASSSMSSISPTPQPTMLLTSAPTKQPSRHHHHTKRPPTSSPTSTPSYQLYYDDDDGEDNTIPSNPSANINLQPTMAPSAIPSAAMSTHDPGQHNISTGISDVHTPHIPAPPLSVPEILELWNSRVCLVLFYILFFLMFCCLLRKLHLLCKC